MHLIFYWQTDQMYAGRKNESIRFGYLNQGIQESESIRGPVVWSLSISRNSHAILVCDQTDFN